MEDYFYFLVPSSDLHVPSSQARTICVVLETTFIAFAL